MRSALKPVFRSLLLLALAPAALATVVLIWAGNSLWIPVLGIGSALAVALWLTWRSARALMAVERALERLRQGDQEVRLPERAPAGLGGISRSFNQLAAALEDQRAELQAEIDERTSDLRQTTEALEIRNVEIDLARRRAVEASRAKSQFLASMTHELRTPLNGITGFANLLGRTPLSDEQQDYVQTISRSSGDLLDIINDILDFSKLESGKLDIDRQVFDIRDCLDEAVGLLAPQAHAKDLELVLMIYNDLPDLLVGDCIRLRQVLINLIGNAIKFTDEGEVVVRAMLSDGEAEDARMEVAVTDTGIGISEELLPQLFAPFSQASTSTSRLYGGTGLGLSICRRLVQSMGGSIEVDSREDAGSCFRFTLPLVRPSPEERPPAAAPRAAGERVLLHDPHALSAASIRGRLEHAGVEVQSFSTLEGILAEDGDPGVPVVLGCSGRECRGGRLNQALAALRRSRVRPILVLAGTSDRGELERVLRIGADRCISKPASDDALLEALSGLCSRSGEGGPGRRPAIPKGPPQLQRRHLLVADDNPINLKLMSTLLAQTGAHVSRATNGREVLELLDTVRFDLVLLDLRMPEKDGLETARAIRDRPDEGARQLPLVALSADAAPASQEAAFRAGMDDFLVKPVSEERLWGVLVRLLDPEAPEDEPVPPEQGPGEGAPREREGARDLGAAVRVSGGDPRLAEEMFRMLLEGLPDELALADTYLRERQWDALREQVHRIQGSTAVCGVPRLHAAVSALWDCVDRKDPDQALRWLEQIRASAAELGAPGPAASAERMGGG